jgi:RND family efflux transporter MFP subunit
MEEIIKRFLSVILIPYFFVFSAYAAEPLVVDAVDAPTPELDCVIEPSEVLNLGSAVPGVVESIHADRNDLVKKGAVLVELESSVEQRTLELAKARAGLNTAIELRKEGAAFGYLTQRRNQKLLKTSAISVHEMDKLKSETHIAELQVILEKDNQSIAQLEYRRALALLHQRTIRSPVEGVVMERFKSVGEYVEDQPVIRVAQLDPLHVEVIVSVDYLGRIVQGMQAKVTPGLVGAQTYLATVERVDRVADAASGTYGVRLILPNPDYKIPAGLRCKLDFIPLQGPARENIVRGTPLEPAAEQGSGAQIGEQEAFAPQPVLTLSGLPPVMPQVEASQPLEACYSIGPVVDEVLARQLSARFEQQSATPVLHAKSVDVISGYQVLAVPEPTPQATHQLLARFATAGISDRFLVRSGDTKGRVSLGYFRGLQPAVKLQERLALKGFEAEIVPRTKQAKQYWLDVSFKAGAALPRQLSELAARLAPKAAFKPLTCSPQLVRR